MKKYIILFLLLMQLYGIAQIHNRNILQKNYDLNFISTHLISQKDFKPYPNNPEQWKAQVPDSILKHLIQEAESEINYVFQPISASVALTYVRSGDRSEHAAISFGKRAVLLKFILAESMEHKGRFMEPIINGLWSICEESFWGVPAHIGNTGLPDIENPVVELFSAETAALMGLTDYFVGNELDKINPLLRKRMLFETNRRVFEPMLTKSSYYGWMSKTKPVNNWNPWIMSNWIAATLLLEKDSNRRALMIHQSLIGLDSYLNSLGDDGGCDEGPSYWFAAGGSTFDCLELLSYATRGTVDIFKEPLIKNMASFIYKSHIGKNYFVNFSDADPKVVADGLLLFRLGKSIQDSSLIKMGMWAYHQYNYEQYSFKPNRENFYKPRFIQNILTIKDLPQNNINLIHTNDTWVEDIQVMTARSNNGLYIAAHGGHNAESHNHNDVGDFIVYASEEPLIIDVGRGNYTARTFSSARYQLWFTQSNYHNLPIINGRGQLAGRSYEASKIKYLPSSKSSSLSLNIAPAYDSSAGVKIWTRNIILQKQKEQIILEQEAEFVKDKNQVQQIFMTTCDVDTNAKGSIILTTPLSKKYQISYDSNKEVLSIDYPSMEGPEYSSFKTKWDNRSIKRIILSSQIPGTTFKMNHTITPYH